MLDGRKWLGAPGASTEALVRLKAVAPPELPARYLDLLAVNDGGEGVLAVNPYTVSLDPATTVANAIASQNYGQADFHGFLVIGGNGGGEYIAFDTRGDAPWPVVMIDMVAGAGSVEIIARDFDAFSDFIGVESTS